MTQKSNNPGRTDLQNLHTQAGTNTHTILTTQSDSKMLEGHFSYEVIEDGLSIHYGEFTELQSMTMTEKLPAGLSFNLLFHGSVSFELAGKPHRLHSENLEACCALFTLNRCETLQRHLSAGMEIKKLNLFVEYQWLKARCQTDQQLAHIDRLFEDHATVRMYPPTPNLIELAHRLIQCSHRSDLSRDLIIEGAVLQLLSACIDEAAKPTPSHLCQQILTLINHEDPRQPLTLKAIANQLNLSVSTLQRRFKTEAGMTVIDFSRNLRLERAKQALINDRISIGEAAFMAGYRHSSNFIAAFTKHFATPPSAFTATRRLSP